MALVYSSYFIVSLILYISVQIFRLAHFPLPEILNSYLTDLLCLPILLTLTLIGLRILKKDKTLMISKAMIFVIWIQYAILFEWILPANSANYTADAFDVLAYGIGAIGFYYFQKKKLEQRILSN